VLTVFSVKLTGDAKITKCLFIIFPIAVYLKMVQSLEETVNTTNPYRLSATVKIEVESSATSMHLASNTQGVVTEKLVIKSLCFIKQQITKYLLKYRPYRGLGSSVGMATGYGLDGPGIESRWGCDCDFSHTFRPALEPTQPPV
jgi:hypothetical protein